MCNLLQKLEADSLQLLPHIMLHRFLRHFLLHHMLLQNMYTSKYYHIKHNIAFYAEYEIY